MPQKHMVEKTARKIGLGKKIKDFKSVIDFGAPRKAAIDLGPINIVIEKPKKPKK